jgi:hypothetical protein
MMSCRGVNDTDIIRAFDCSERLIIWLDSYFWISAKFSDSDSNIRYGYRMTDIRQISDIRISSRIPIRISDFGYPDIFPFLISDI